MQCGIVAFDAFKVSSLRKSNLIGHLFRKTELKTIVQRDRSIFQNASDKFGFTQIPIWQTIAKNSILDTVPIKMFAFSTSANF